MGKPSYKGHVTSSFLSKSPVMVTPKKAVIIGSSERTTHLAGGGSAKGEDGCGSASLLSLKPHRP